MDLRKLKTLIDLVAESGISELEVTEENDKVRIVNKVQTVAVAAPAVAAAPVVAATPAAAPAAAEAAPAMKKVGLDTHLGTQPMGELTYGALGTVPMIISFWPVIFGGAYGMTKRREAIAKANQEKAVAEERQKTLETVVQCIEKEQGKDAADKARAAMTAALDEQDAKAEKGGEDK